MGTARAEVYQDGNPYASTFSTAYIIRHAGVTYPIRVGSAIVGQIPAAELSERGVALVASGVPVRLGEMVGGLGVRDLPVGATMNEVSSITLNGQYSVTFEDTNGGSVPSQTAFYRILAVTDTIDSLMVGSTLIDLYGGSSYKYRAEAYTEDVYAGIMFNREENTVVIDDAVVSFNQSFKFEDVKTIIIYIEVR